MYRALDAVLVRAAAHQARTALPAWPDLNASTDEHARQWCGWLEQIWSRDAFAEAIEVASPVLARQVSKILAGHHRDARQVRRVVMSVARYVLRMTDRATPFGLFAGVVPAAFGRPSVRWGQDHHVLIRPDAGWLATVVTTLEECPELLRRLPVVTNNLCAVRGRRLVMTSQQHVGDCGDGDISLAAPVEVSVRDTRAARAALRYAHTPIVAADLTAKLAADFPTTPALVIERMLAELVRLRLLLTSLCPPMTVTDSLAHIACQLAAIDAGTIPQIADQVRELQAIHASVSRHNAPGSQPGRRDLRACLPAQMRRVAGLAEPLLTVDTRLDADIVLPTALAREAEAVAAALTRLTPHPSGLPAWQDYHAAFLERYGTGALVPVLEIISPGTGLGFPATFRGSARNLLAPPLSARDERLITLAYTAAMNGEPEILVDDQQISDLAAGEGALTQVPPHAELFVQAHAASAVSLERGEFTLVVTGASRAAGTTTGRFLDLLEAADRDRISRAYARLSSVRAGALPVQVSCPPVYARSEGVARAPAVLPNVISAAEYREPVGNLLPLEDLAVSGDAEGLYLVSLARQRVVEPTVLNAVEFRNFSHPLIRFLCEISRARAAVYMPFSWGAANSLPFLPRLRYGRTVLSPARWNLPATGLPHASAPFRQWKHAIAGWRQQVRVPDAVYLGEADNLLRLNLDHDMHLTLLRAHLDRRGHATLSEAPGLDVYGWLDGRAHEICIPLTSAMPARPSPAQARITRARLLGRDHGHLPGRSPRLYIKLYGHPGHQDAVLAQVPDLLATFEDPPWWYVRYADPEPHLRLRLRLPGADAYGHAAHRAGAWAARLRDTGLAGSIQFDTYYPETGRYGSGPAMAAAESVFAADSAAAIAQIICTAGGHCHPHAITAASLADIATAFTANTTEGMSWLATHIPRDSAITPVSRPVHDQAMRLADPREDHAVLRATPGGDQVLTTWQQRASALAAYRDALLGADEVPADSVLASLLHMHYIRVAGPSPEAEQLCHRLTRSAALGWITRNRNTEP
jgi:thiopeptide-type bacteriocin biosynthesis protein